MGHEWVRVLGEGAATTSPPAMGLGSAVSIPGGSRAKLSRQTDVLRGSARKLFHLFHVPR